MSHKISGERQQNVVIKLQLLSHIYAFQGHLTGAKMSCIIFKIKLPHNK